jgi:outer membrane protein assembly factor BamB
VLADVQAQARQLPQRRSAGVPGRLAGGRSWRLLAAMVVLSTMVLSTLLLRGAVPAAGPIPSEPTRPRSGSPGTFGATAELASADVRPSTPSLAGLISARSFPMFKGNPGRTGEADGPGPTSDGVLGRKRVAAAFASGVAVTPGALYAVDEQDRIVAVSPDLKNLLWTTGDRGYRGTPAVAGDRLLAFREDGSLAANDRLTGFSDWSVSGPYDTAIPPLVIGSVALVVRENGRIDAIDTTTGSQRWSRAAQGTPAGLTASDGVDAFLGTADGHVTAYAVTDGRQRWTADTGSVTVDVAAVRDASVVAIARHADGATELVALRASDGAVRWRVPVASGVSGSAVVDARAVYLTADGTHQGGRVVSAYSTADGASLWESNSEVSAAVTLAGRTAFAVTPRARIVAIDLGDGHTLWESSDSDISNEEPAIAGAVLYVGTTSGDLIAMGP